jgi:hypothetical protein
MWRSSILCLSVLASAVIAAPSPALGGDGRGVVVVSTDDVLTTPTALIGGDNRGVHNPAASGETAAAAVSQTSASDQGDETASSAALNDLDVIPTTTNGSDVLSFDWSVTRYLNGSMCFVDGLGSEADDDDDDDNNGRSQCYSEWWLHMMVFMVHFVFIALVLTIVCLAVVVWRRTRALNAVSVQMTSLLAGSSDANSSQHGGDEGKAALVVPPVYRIHGTTKPETGLRYTQSFA